MAQPYVGEIRMFAGNFAPAGWQFCDGSILSISENETLFQLIGTTYGGDGQSTFGLPDMRGRLPLHQGNGFTFAQTGGVETVTLTVTQMAAHSHAVLVTNTAATSNTLAGNVLASTASGSLYLEVPMPNANFAANAIGQSGGSQPHENRQPFLCVSFIISLFGIFPSPS
jgi:microcystin-dependent protein